MLLLANTAPSGSPDPQVNYTLQEWQLLILTHDGLVAFKRVAGKEGGKKVPDLAESIPTPTDGGKTYTFTLRPGIKFSNGQTVTGQDVKATFERLFKIGNSPNAGTWYNVIEGGDACVKTPKTCDLSKGIVVNGEQGDVPPDPRRPGVPRQARRAVRVHPPGEHADHERRHPAARHRPLQVGRIRAEQADQARPQPALQGVVEGRTAGREPEHHHPEVRAQRRGRVHPGREQPGRLGLRPAPGRSFERARHQVLRPAVRQSTDGGLLLRVQRQRAAVQQPEGTAGSELRNRPERAW